MLIGGLLFTKIYMFHLEPSLSDRNLVPWTSVVTDACRSSVHSPPVSIRDPVKLQRSLILGYSEPEISHLFCLCADDTVGAADLECNGASIWGRLRRAGGTPVTSDFSGRLM